MRRPQACTRPMRGALSLLAVAMVACLILSVAPGAIAARILKQDGVTTTNEATNSTTSLCRWFLSDGVTPDDDPIQQELDTCRDCQEQCSDARRCITFSFNGSAVTESDNVNACSGQTPVANYSGPCRWYLIDGVTPDTDPEQDDITACPDCLQRCRGAPNCYSWAFDGSDVMSAHSTNSSVCSSSPSPSDPNTASLCRWFQGDGETRDTDPAQDNITNCIDCQELCSGAANCMTWSFNGSEAAGYDATYVCTEMAGQASYTGPCRWFKEDGVTPDTNGEQDAIGSCTGCQQGCSRAPNCLNWAFNGSDVAYYTNRNACGGGQSSNHTGPCRWFLGDGMTPDSDTAQDNLTSCSTCQGACFSAPNCIYWSFNGSDVAYYGNTSVCGGGQDTNNNTSLCQWFLSDGVTPDPDSAQADITSCVECQEACYDASRCIRWSFNGSDVAHYTNTSACPEHDGSSPCRWFLEDGVTPDTDPSQRIWRTCRDCQEQCLVAPDCIFWSYNGTEPAEYSTIDTCGLNVSDGMCQWFLSDGFTPDSQDEQDNVTDCVSCQKQCSDAPNCLYYSYNGTEAKYYRVGCYNNEGPCQWYLSDGETPDTLDEQLNVTDCASCQQQCEAADNCIFWNWNGTETIHYSVDDGCNANRTRPCRWFTNDRTPDTEDVQGDVSGCIGCQEGCAEADHCIYFSFNNSDIVSFANNTVCPFEHSGPCRWFLEDGSPDHDLRQEDIETCSECQSACASAPSCIFWSIDGSQLYNYTNSFVCPAVNRTSACRWFTSDGVTPDTDTSQDSIRNCRQCQAQCETAPDCIFWSFNNSATSHFNNTETCGLNVSDGMCQWFLSDGVTPDALDQQVNVTDCVSCQSECYSAANCIYYSYNGTEATNYRTTCTNLAVPIGPCRWFLYDGTTPDTDEAQGTADSCVSCREACRDAPRCYHFSWEGSRVAPYESVNTCGQGNNTASPAVPDA